jgi:DNA-binding CsgD family transcriptional regulator
MRRTLKTKPILLSLSEAISEMETLHEPASFFMSVVEIFAKWFDADIHGYGAVNLKTAKPTGQCRGSRNDSEFIHTYYENAITHPAFLAVLRMGPGWALRTTDLIPHEVFRQTAIYKNLFVPWGLEYDIAANCVWDEKQHTSLRAWRGGENFTDKEVEDLRAFAQACKQVFEVRIQTTVKRLESADEKRVLADYELTPREHEVLHWVCEGKRNPEIAVILQVSERTVHKHVQHILMKLGVETRTCAANLVLRLLNGHGVIAV